MRSLKLKPQITVFLENQPGTMAKVCKLISDQKINILAFTLFGTVDHGVLRMIVDRTQEAMNVMGKSGFLAIESKVIEIPARNSPGTLYTLCSLLYDRGVNIEYGYGSTSPYNKVERFFLQASNTAKAMKVLEEGFPLPEEDD